MSDADVCCTAGHQQPVFQRQQHRKGIVTTLCRLQGTWGAQGFGGAGLWGARKMLHKPTLKPDRELPICLVICNEAYSQLLSQVQMQGRRFDLWVIVRWVMRYEQLGRGRGGGQLARLICHEMAATTRCRQLDLLLCKLHNAESTAKSLRPLILNAKFTTTIISG